MTLLFHADPGLWEVAEEEETEFTQIAFAVVGIMTMTSAVLGCSPVIMFLECCAGVKV